MYPPPPTIAEQERDILQKHVKMIEKRCASLSSQLAIEIESKEALKEEMNRLGVENKLLLEDKRSALDSIEVLSDQVKDLQDQTSCIPDLHEKIRILERSDLDHKERILVMKRKDEEWKSEVNELLRECASLRRELATSEQEKQVVKSEAAKLLALFEKETQENLRNQERIFESMNPYQPKDQRFSTPLRSALTRKLSRKSEVDDEIDAVRKLKYSVCFVTKSKFNFLNFLKYLTRGGENNISPSAQKGLSFRVQD